MKRRDYLVACIIFLVLVVFVSNVYSEYADWIWTVQPGTIDWDRGYSVALDTSGNVYVTGFTDDSLDGNPIHGPRDIFITKYDSDGNRLWTVQPGTTDWDSGYGVAVDSSGNVYVTGITENSLDGNTYHGMADIFITKYDTDGNRLWTVQPGTCDMDEGHGIAVDTSGNVYVTGYTSGSLDGNTNHGTYDIFITKYDTDGNHLWTVQPGTGDLDNGHGIALDTSGNVYVTGHTSGSLDGNISHGSTDIFITKYDTDGNRLWTVQHGTGVGEEGYSIAVDTSSNVYVTGVTGGSLDGNSNHGSADIFITKYDTDGNRLWTVQPGTNLWDESRGIAVDSSGNVYVTGHTSGSLDGNTNHGSRDIFITKYDTGGNRLWTIQPGTVNWDEGFGIAVESSGNVYVTGDTSGSLDGNTHIGEIDIFITKYLSTCIEQVTPNTVVDLDILGAGYNYVTLQWTIPGTESNCKPEQYDIRYSLNPISNDTDFNSATQVTSEPTPGFPTSNEIFTISDLAANTTYYFALKVKGTNWSEMSNVVSTHTGTLYGNGSKTISFTPNDGYHITDWVVNVRLKNDGFQTAINISAEIVDKTAWVIVDDATANYPDINSGQEVWSLEVQPFMFDLTSRPADTNYINIWLNISYDLGGGRGRESQIVELELRIPDTRDSNIPTGLTCKSTGNGITIKWDKISEIDGYNVYKLIAGKWDKINNQIVLDRTYLDKNVIDGREYSYNVTSIKDDKESGYSAVLKIIFEKTFTNLSEVKPYPNPAKDKVTFNKLPKGSKIRIYTLSGELIYEVRSKSNKEEWYLINKAGKSIGNGIYLYTIENNGETKTGKLAIVR